MKAKITAPNGFRIAPEGHTVVLLKQGDIVEGNIAAIAISAGCATQVDETAESLEWKDIAPNPPQPVFKRPRGRPRKVSA